MKCPKCQLENREGANFCNECGYKFELTCPACGATNGVGSKFCDECGSKLTLPIEQAPKDLSFEEKLAKIQKYLPKGLTDKILSQRDRIEGERKQVTVEKKANHTADNLYAHDQFSKNHDYKNWR